MPDNIDGNASPQTIVDAESLGQAFGRSLKEALAPLVGQQSAGGGTATKTKSRLEEKIEQVLGREGADQDRVAELLDILDAARSDMTEERRNEALVQMAKERDARAVQTIRQEIQAFADHDEDIADTSELIEKRVIDDFNAKPEYERARQEFANGVLDLRAIKAIVKVHVDRRAKIRGTDKGAGGPAGVKSSATTTPATAADGAAGSKDNLTHGQRELYSSHYSMLTRHGYKHDDAHKDAMAAALRRKTK